MKILVTGGAGFIGSHYIRTLLTGSYEGFDQARVTVLDKLTYTANLANLALVACDPCYAFRRVVQVSTDEVCESIASLC